MDIQQKPSLHADWIDFYAIKIVKNLQEAGFETYLVGGCVRDLLVGIHPKDFDIATNALPNQVRKKVPNAYVIGRRFKLVLVKRGDQQFEVATFRRNVNLEELSSEEVVEGDNYFGTVEEDAHRRDFTANAVFYDPVAQKLIDHCGGIDDINHRVLRMIGNPVERFIEDPIRILRAIRLSHKLGFSIDPEMRAAIVQCSDELKKSVLPRRREEWLKFLRLQEPFLAFLELYDLGIMKSILPNLHAIFEDPEKIAIFETYLSRINLSGINKADPIELFAGFMLAYCKAYFGEIDITEAMVTEDEKITAFMRDEIGIFKLETTIFLKGLHLMGGLHRTETYSRKGERRKMAYIYNDSFSLALKLAILDYSVTGEELTFWVQELEKYAMGPQPKDPPPTTH